MSDKDKTFSILLLLGGGCGEKSHSRFLHIGISDTIIYLGRKSILTPGKAEEAG